SVMLSAPATPSPSAPAVPPLPSLQHPEPLLAPELRERAREATVLGSLARAEALLERALALEPADAAAWNDLGVVLVRRRQHRRGIEAIQRSLALDPKHAEAHLNLAVALEQDGQTLGAGEATVLGSLARAEALLERALALEPADAAAWNDLGVVLVRRRQHRRGIEAIQRSLALDPKHAEAHLNLAVALEQDGQTLGAA